MWAAVPQGSGAGNQASRQAGRPQGAGFTREGSQLSGRLRPAWVGNRIAIGSTTLQPLDCNVVDDNHQRLQAECCLSHSI